MQEQNIISTYGWQGKTGITYFIEKDGVLLYVDENNKIIVDKDIVVNMYKDIETFLQGNKSKSDIIPVLRTRSSIQYVWMPPWFFIKKIVEDKKDNGNKLQIINSELEVFIQELQELSQILQGQENVTLYLLSSAAWTGSFTGLQYMKKEDMLYIINNREHVRIPWVKRSSFAKHLFQAYTLFVSQDIDMRTDGMYIEEDVYILYQNNTFYLSNFALLMDSVDNVISIQVPMEEYLSFLKEVEEIAKQTA